MKYRKKPVVIEAWHTPTGKEQDGWAALPKFLMSYFGDTLFKLPRNKWLIKTPEGDMTADAGDYIIKGIKGEIYPCKPDIFEATYELVDEVNA